MPLSAPSYSTGTWTPVLTFATPGNLSVAYTNQIGNYSRVGSKVSVTFRLLTSTFTHTTASGNLNITGLPFAARTVANQQWPGSLMWQGITKASYTQMIPTIASAASLITIIACGSGQTATNITTADTPTAGTVLLHGFIEYEAA